jgi:hypothetical protein
MAAVEPVSGNPGLRMASGGRRIYSNRCPDESGRLERKASLEDDSA